MADSDSTALTRKLGPLPVWLWGVLVLIAAVIYSSLKSRKGGAVDSKTGLPAGSQADQQALQDLQTLQQASQSRSGAGGTQAAPIVITTGGMSGGGTYGPPPLWGRGYGTPLYVGGGPPSRDLDLGPWSRRRGARGSHAPRARMGGPTARGGPGHVQGWGGNNNGEARMPDGGPGAAQLYGRTVGMTNVPPTAYGRGVVSAINPAAGGSPFGANGSPSWAYANDVGARPAGRGGR
jgi:hypothetical protein